MQILFTGVNALSVIALLSLSIGVVLIIQGVSLLPQFGQGNLIYVILIIVITRELGPILTAFIIIARSGTAIATEIGNMVISHEIEAYMSVGINPISYIVVPRFLGVTFSMLILNLYFNIFGLVGSYFISRFINPIPFIEYFQNLLTVLSTADIISSLVKSLIFGAIISFVATYNGFKVMRSSTEIPQVVIKAVGQGFVFCIIADAIITLIYYI
jgi:phospholipid/cholesterol/gamma-HCH transport system permease protein